VKDVHPELLEHIDNEAFAAAPKAKAKRGKNDPAQAHKSKGPAKKP
jgi:hypothetical protein